jgi:hypothetical protein
MSAHEPHAALSSRAGSSEPLRRKKRASQLTQRNGRTPIARRRYFSTAPCRCDRNTSELPQCGQNRLESGFISLRRISIFVSKAEKQPRSATWLTILQHIRQPPTGLVGQPDAIALSQAFQPNHSGSSANHPLEYASRVHLLKLCLTRTHLVRKKPAGPIPGLISEAAG